MAIVKHGFEWKLSHYATSVCHGRSLASLSCSVMVHTCLMEEVLRMIGKMVEEKVNTKDLICEVEKNDGLLMRK